MRRRTDFWAGHGFVVIQPTHLDSRTLGLTPADPRFAEIWRIRIEDLGRVIDELEHVEGAVPGLRGRIDRSRIAVAGHSWGGQTASTLLGARVLDADGEPGEDFSDSRVRAGVLLATTGEGGSALSPFAAEHFPRPAGHVRLSLQRARCRRLGLGGRPGRPARRRGPAGPARIQGVSRARRVCPRGATPDSTIPSPTLVGA